MTSMRRLASTGIVLAVLASALLGIGCGETGDADPTPVQTFKITPAANATAPPSASAVASAVAESPSAATTPGGATTIEIVGVSNTFDKEELSASAGSMTIDFDNQDGGVVHNLHIFEGGDADGEDVAETELEIGPIEQTLTFDVEPGEYFYQCDAHPNTMSGILTVEE